MKKVNVFICIICILIGTAGFRPVFAETTTELDEETVTTDSENDEDAEDEEPEEDETENEKILVILAVSAGGEEMIELFRNWPEKLPLSGVSLNYENATGSVNKPIYEFPEGSEMVGEKILFRYKSTDDADKADLTYTTNMSQAGGRVYLTADGEEIDSVCWGNYPDCENTGKLDTKFLVRDLETFLFSLLDSYIPDWVLEREVLTIPEDGGETGEGNGGETNGGDDDKPNVDPKPDDEDEEIKTPVCKGLKFSEIFTYFINDRGEQFVELFNPSSRNIALDECVLRYKNKNYELSGTVPAKKYFVIYPEEIELSLTKNPTKSNLIELVDADESVADSLEYFNGQKKGFALAKFDDEKEVWELTKVLTPGSENKRAEDDKQVVDETETAEPVCRGIQFSEILSYYESEKSEQFIELFNPTATKIRLDGCFLRYKNKLHALSGLIQPEGYFVFFPADFTLTKNPVNSNLIEIIDADGSIVDSLTYFNGQKKAVALAQFGYNDDGSEQWLQTYSPTPSEENNYQKYKTCPAGKVINEETGNCVKILSLSTELAPCPEGYYRNPLTNRCRKYATTTTSTLKECAEGYERNPLTNRCRKIVKNDGANYEVKEEKFEEKSSFVAVWAIVAVGVIGAIYVLFEYRKELFGLMRRRKS
ncbi:lamin tail domain-containing protein [Candidatus Saccharibacteria bacterium]|nr:lamin tail domain-containing protein [Candidatus Saccharibacteria bacterium]